MKNKIKEFNAWNEIKEGFQILRKHGKKDLF